jgi:hypothetical protein
VAVVNKAVKLGSEGCDGMSTWISQHPQMNLWYRRPRYAGDPVKPKGCNTSRSRVGKP